MGMAIGDDPLLDFAVGNTEGRLRATQSDLVAAVRSLESMQTQIAALSALVVSLEASRDAVTGLPAQLYLTWYDSGPNSRVDAADEATRDAVRHIRTAVEISLDELQRLYGAIASQRSTVETLGARQQTLTTQLNELRALQSSTPPSTTSPSVLVSGRIS